MIKGSSSTARRARAGQRDASYRNDFDVVVPTIPALPVRLSVATGDLEPVGERLAGGVGRHRHLGRCEVAGQRLRPNGATVDHVLELDLGERHELVRSRSRTTLGFGVPAV